MVLIFMSHISYFVDDGSLDQDEFNNAPLDFGGKARSAHNHVNNSVPSSLIPSSKYLVHYILSQIPPHFITSLLAFHISSGIVKIRVIL